MASIQKRGKTYQFTVSRVVNGKQKPIRKGGFRTKREAQIATAEVEAELLKDATPNLKPVPFDGYFEKWLSLYKTNVNSNTLERYRDTLRTVKDCFGSNSPIQNINKPSYQAFLNEYGKTHAKQSTRKLNTHIRACVKEAIDEGFIRVDFTRGAVLTGYAGKRPEEKHLDYQESQRLLQALYILKNKTITHYLLLLGLTSGMRFAEMVGLTRKDFNFFNNTININKSWGYTKQMHEGFGPTKNEQSVRVIKMDNKAKNTFKNLFDTTPENIHKLVFYSASSKYKVISNGNANKVLKGILTKMDIDPISVHGLRHTHASVLLYEEISVYYVSKRLGHGDIETTLNTYSHVVKELEEREQVKSVSVFEKMLG